MMTLQSLRIVTCLLLTLQTVSCSIDPHYIYRPSSQWCSLTGDIRLVDGHADNEGRVDICYDGYWHSACDDNWGPNEARVACRQLGYQLGGVVFDRYSTGTGYYKHIDCRGSESRLTDCTVTDNSGCQDSHGDSVGVRCTKTSLLPYGPTANDFNVSRGDDTSSGQITLRQGFRFYGSIERQIYVNINGILSFKSGFRSYTPRSLPFNSVPLIIPFWRDADLRQAGNISYRQASDYRTLWQAYSLLLLDYALDNPLLPTWVFVATWSNVPALGTATPGNTYQVVLMTDGEVSYVSFLYDNIQWGGGAGVGFNAGDGNRSLTVPGALTSKSLKMGNHSNIGRPGVFIYRVDATDQYPSDLYPYDPYEPHDRYDPYPFYFCELCEDEYGRPYFGPYDEYLKPNRCAYTPRQSYLQPSSTTTLPPKDTYEPDYEELDNRNRGRSTLSLFSCITSYECGRGQENCSGSGTQYDSCGRRCTCKNNRLQNCCRVRKEWRSMTQMERCRYVSVITAASTRQPWKRCYDELIRIHKDQFGRGIHIPNYFLPWHRWYILALENLLRQIDCHVTVPYWDWSSEPQTWQNSIVWDTHCGFGGNGNRFNNDYVRTGPFRRDVWQLTPSAHNGYLRRRFQTVSVPDSASIAFIQRISSFYFWEDYVRVSLHDSVHCMIGGTMCTSDSANAPEFFLHHGFIDQIWAAWQNKGPAFKQLSYYASTSSSMPGAFGYSPRHVYDLNNQPGCVRVCVEPSARPVRVSTTYTPVCPTDMNSAKYSPVKLAGIIPRPYPRVPEESFRLFNASLSARRIANRYADIFDNYNQLYSILQANGYANSSAYRPPNGGIQLDPYLYGSHPYVPPYNPDLPPPPQECRP